MVSDVNKKLREAYEEFSKEAKERLGDKLISLVLYGSVAKGRARSESDIDVFAVVSDVDAKENLFDIAAEFLKGGVLFSVMVETPSKFRELQKAGSPFISSIFREGVILHGRRSKRRVEVG
ncbi:MAG: nucleotidyltransferase domain-containing protein [Candidatus Hydrothermarchaeota archaeon]|nr:nucleotidyltransferase domain-containing protein [Candidatus Hydrothermarchaeota archaeon]